VSLLKLFAVLQWTSGMGDSFLVLQIIEKVSVGQILNLEACFGQWLCHTQDDLHAMADPGSNFTWVKLVIQKEKMNKRCHRCNPIFLCRSASVCTLDSESTRLSEIRNNSYMSKVALLTTCKNDLFTYKVTKKNLFPRLETLPSKWKNATFLSIGSGKGTPQWMAPEVGCVQLWSHLMGANDYFSSMGPSKLYPEDCWQTDPAKRPSFEEIISMTMSLFRKAGSSAQEEED
ncbi:hypothetical protein HID58_052518, partial [Brassica napus]